MKKSVQTSSVLIPGAVFPLTTEPRELDRTWTVTCHAGHPRDASETDSYIATIIDLQHRTYNRIGSEAEDAVPEEKNEEIRLVSRSWIPRTVSQSRYGKQRLRRWRELGEVMGMDHISRTT